MPVAPRGVVGLLKVWRDWRRFRKLAAEDREIVFFAEDAASWVHLGPIVEALGGQLGRRVCYLSSDPADPVFERQIPNVESFAIGSGALRTYAFTDMQASVLVMTMPDLETFHIKRSKSHAVHYAYVFHSLVSSHMVYRPCAFDYYDTILCAGPHHVEEIRAAEALRALPEKRLVEHGYGRLDAVIAEARRQGPPPPGEPLRVLVAPSWGDSCLLETRGVELTRVLLDAGLHVTLRPHPMTGRHSPGVIDGLRAFRGHERFELEVDIASQESFHRSHLMVSDWSGAALEYAFGLERPVLFVDVPRKVNDAGYEALGCEPLEVSIRHEIGEILPPDRLGDAPQAIRRLCAAPGAFRERIVASRARHVFNVGASGRVGAEEIAGLTDRAAGTG